MTLKAPRIEKLTWRQRGRAKALLHFDFDITAKSGQALFFSTLSEKWSRRQAQISVKGLKCPIEHHLEAYNQNPKPFRLHKKTEDILASVARAARVMVK